MRKNLIWKEIPCSNSGDRSFHTSTLFKDYLITYGGYSKSCDKVLSDFQILNLKKNSFEAFNLEGDEPCSREQHSACLIDSNKILIFAGYDGQEILHDLALLTIQDTIRNSP